MTLQDLPLDKDGFLVNLNDWSPTIAEEIAAHENIALTPEHWEIIDLVREFYDEFGLSPVNRVLVKTTGAKLGQDKGSSIYLMQLFPGGPAKIACKIAGLPKPNNCL
ncbi:TusE/DsrC/DsvC family sulfur relay protein [Hahella sp. NBU794]|uniref:TusE/DsrC/DsvC family sulfur relay protein n=1 Tax=Hahella sp. NBU794 TaxID=3422590 RepID=UPI003D6F876E